MDAEPTPTRGIPARARLAAARRRLRELAGGVLRRPAARRALVVGGLALAGWLLGAGAGAWAADVPTPATHHRTTLGDPVGDQLSQTTALVHTGADAVDRTKSSLDRHPLAKRAGGPGLGHPVGDQVSQATGLVHTGADAVARTESSLERRSLAERSGATPVREGVRWGAGRVVHPAAGDVLTRRGPVRDVRDGAAKAVSRDSVDRAASWVRGARDRFHRTVARRASRDDVRRITGPVGSLLDSGADKVRRALPVHEALGAPSSVVDSMAGQIRHAGGRLTDPDAGHGRQPSPRANASLADDAVSSPAHVTSRAARHLTGSARPMVTAHGGQVAPAPVGVITAHPMCAHSELACGHAGARHPHAPDVPAPAGQQPGSHGMVPSPVSGGGQPLPGAGDVTWIGTDRIPHRLAVIAPRRGVLPPVVRTAADEPSLSPD